MPLPGNQLKPRLGSFALPTPKGWLGIVLACAGALAAFGQVASEKVQEYNPKVATWLWPGNDQAWAHLGSQQLTRIPNVAEVLSEPGATIDDSPALRESMSLSRRALSISAVQVVALRNIAIGRMLAGETEDMKAVLDAANGLTRRDVPTQMLLTRQYFIDEDLKQGLASFDRALRVSARAHEQLFPVLGEAVKVPEFKEAFRPYVHADNAWLAGFLEFALTNKLAVRPIGELIAEGMPLPSRPGLQIRSLAPTYLVPEGEVALARRIAMQAAEEERPAKGGGLSDPTFSDPAIVMPFGWSLTESREISIYRPLENEPLEISSSTAYSGDLATQMVNLPPGRYRLTSKGRFGENVGWIVACEGTGQQLTADVRTAPTTFTVPAEGCAAQWVRLHAQALGRVDAAIERIDIAPVASPAS